MSEKNPLTEEFISLALKTISASQDAASDGRTAFAIHGIALGMEACFRGIVEVNDRLKRIEDRFESSERQSETCPKCGSDIVLMPESQSAYVWKCVWCGWASGMYEDEQTAFSAAMKEFKGE